VARGLRVLSRQRTLCEPSHQAHSYPKVDQYDLCTMATKCITFVFSKYKTDEKLPVRVHFLFSFTAPVLESQGAGFSLPPVRMDLRSEGNSLRQSLSFCQVVGMSRLLESVDAAAFAFSVAISQYDRRPAQPKDRIGRCVILCSNSSRISVFPSLRRRPYAISPGGRPGAHRSHTAP
jgi:hypothetical protein